MDAIIMKDSGQMVSFFKKLEAMFEKIEIIKKNAYSPFNGEYYMIDKELFLRLKISRRMLQEYRNNGLLLYILLEIITIKVFIWTNVLVSSIHCNGYVVYIFI